MGQPKRKISDICDYDDFTSNSAIKRHLGFTHILIDEENEIRSFSLKKVGIYKSKGYANGRSVYMGSRGGMFYIGLNGWKTYVQHGVVIYS